MFIAFLFPPLFLAFITLFKSDKYTKFSISCLIGIILILFAGTRGEEVGRDYAEYSRLFSLYKSLSETDLEAFILYEPSILIIPQLLKFLFGTYYLNLTFVTFAILAVSIKLKAIYKSQFFFLSVFIYCTNLFLGQEMITIRAGVACAIFLLSIKDIEEKKHLSFFLKIGLAYLFHYSSIVFLLIWIVEWLKVKYKLLTAALITAIIIAALKINILTLLKLDILFPKVGTYLALLEIEGGDPVNVFNFRILFSLFFLFVFLYKVKLFDDDNFFNILLRIHFISIILFFVLSPTAMVFSLRIFDLLSVVQILLFPYVICLFKEKLVGYLFVALYCCVNYYYIMNISKWFETGYSSWLF